MDRWRATIAPEREATRESDAQTRVDPDRPWITIVWNDPINLMSYVTHVFMTVFGYPKSKAEKLMMDVHQLGRACGVQRCARTDGARCRHAARFTGCGATLQQQD